MPDENPYQSPQPTDDLRPVSRRRARLISQLPAGVLVGGMVGAGFAAVAAAIFGAALGLRNLSTGDLPSAIDYPLEAILMLCVAGILLGGFAGGAAGMVTGGLAVLLAWFTPDRHLPNFRAIVYLLQTPVGGLLGFMQAESFLRGLTADAWVWHTFGTLLGILAGAGSAWIFSRGIARFIESD